MTFRAIILIELVKEVGIVTGIAALLGVELLGFSVGDYVISKSADIGSGLLWKEIKRRLPGKEESLEGQLYDAIEASVKRYMGLCVNKQEQMAAACEMLYGTWIENGHLTEGDVKAALLQVNPYYVAQRNLEVWYRQFYEEIIKRELLYRWYILHTTQDFHEQIQKRDEKIDEKVSYYVGQQQIQMVEEEEKERLESQKRLRDLIFQQILKEDICLKQIYISLHGKLSERNLLNGRLKESSLIVDTTSYIWEWYERNQAPLLFLHGEPGIGKSSLVKLVAATMTATAKTNGFVVFIELHRLGFGEKENALSVLEKYIKNHYPWFFNKRLKEKRLLIIDGLDEIRHMVYDNSLELIRGLENCDWGIPWAGIISGRSQVMKRAIEEVRGEELEMLPLFLDEYELTKRAGEAEDPKEMLKEDLRGIYWNKLTNAFHIEQQLPMGNEQFDELSKSPLLLFLVVWTMKHAGSRFEDFKNTAKLYETIFRHIYTREYNRETEREIYFKSKEYKEYQQMLRYLGGCAYKEHSRAVAIRAIYDYCQCMGQAEMCENWIQLHKKDNPSKLVLLFFLREAYNEMDWQQSEIEFIHKTFYEYLAAVAIIEFLYRNSKELIPAKQLKMLLYLFSDNILEDEILKFIEEILLNESFVVDGVRITKQHFSDILTDVFTQGFNTNYPFFITDENRRCSKICVNSYHELEEKVRVYENNLSKLLKMFVGLETDKTEDEMLDLSCAEFSKANMMWWVFDNTILNESHFEESIISGASFRNCIMRNCIMLSGVADRAEFNNADLCDADFSGAQLCAANFTGALLERTVFEISNLEGAYFCGTKLKETNFASANLTAANFDETVLIDADFHGADLTRADFSNVEIESADWRNCIMEMTKLNGVKIAQFDLDDLNIVEMLAEADLEFADWTGVSEEKKRLLIKGGE